MSFLFVAAEAHGASTPDTRGAGGGDVKMQRLLEVLVVGGAALVGCSSSEGDGDTTGGGADAAGGGPSGLGGDDGDGAGAGHAGGDPGAGAGGATDGAGGSATTAATTSTTSGEAATTTSTGGLGCSATPSPDDPCGCPCCWVEDCGNDADCCPEAFRCTP